ncbi:MAG: spore cortex biosynthesis protein YabQ, partial [Acetatifactor sp.]|nr:spore cortex biosynthesis protein YabQ [Acetatifactor sp.]
MASENEFLLHALLMGIFITFVYDLLRIFRRVVPHKAFFVSLEDLAFWI